MAARTKINLRSFRGVMRSKVLGIPLPVLAVGAGVLGVVLIRRSRRAEGAGDEGGAGIGGTTAGGGAGPFGDGGAGGGGFSDQGGFFAPFPLDVPVGGGAMAGGGTIDTTTPIPTGGTGGGGGNLAARIGIVRVRLRGTAARRAALQGRLLQAQKSGSARQIRLIQQRQQRLAIRQARQQANIQKLRTRRRVLGGKTSSTGA